MVDVGGYVIILLKTKDKKIKLYGSFADKEDLKIDDEILDVNGQTLSNVTRSQAIAHINQCIKSRVICLRCKHTPQRPEIDLNSVQDAFVIAVEPQARERLEKLATSYKIQPVDMAKLCQQLNRPTSLTNTSSSELNGFVDRSSLSICVHPTLIAPEKETASKKSPFKELPVASRTEENRLPSNLSSISSNYTKAPILEVTSNEIPRNKNSQFEKTKLELKNFSADNKEIESLKNRRVSLCVPNLENDNYSLETRRNSSPFTTGGTELLIGQHNDENRLKTTAIIENVRTSPKDISSRDQKSECFIKVDPQNYEQNDNKKIIVAANDHYHNRMMMVMTAMENGPHRELPVDVDNGPHRELPVDVPDTFIARNKTPPRYPPPKPKQVQVQNALRKRKEEEAELLKGSLRGSKKLQALESSYTEKPPPLTGVVNEAYADDENLPAIVQFAEADQGLYEEIHKILDYGELFASLQKLQLQLKKVGINGKTLEPVHNLLQNQDFHRVLSIHNKVQQVWLTSKHKKPITSDAKSLIIDCLKDLQGSSLPEASKLTEFLAKNELEELLEAHDTIARHYYSDIENDATSQPEQIEYKTELHHDPNIKIIRIEKTNEPLGATVRNEGESVIIGRVIKGGAAEKCGLLHEGDEIIEVNGIKMRGKSVNEVCDILSAMTGSLTFFINPCSVKRQNEFNKDVLVYVKALFDYDAEDDLYVPCRELGISFQKGDILIVKSQEDPNWWQAYRYGEHDHSLAGLIPSKSFQQQREALKQTISGERLTKDKSHKAGTFLCTKKNSKKKRKKSPYHTYQDGGYALYSSSSTEEYDGEEIPIYEEVLWYYPSMNHKRPIVLIGPPNIGRHELRQRLMEDSDRFAAAVPHTSRSRKEGEIDGQDYHFITRKQFEDDILTRKFVEHGEYEKAYYGTSLEAIRTVVNSGKICVLNLHAQSLKILRNSDLMPYVVFVAPPSLEKLRQKKIKSGEAYKEEELKDIIEKARDMEDKYGHYFDMIIINNDTERAYHELLHEINKVEREPQWIPASWVRNNNIRYKNDSYITGYYGRGN